MGLGEIRDVVGGDRKTLKRTLDSLAVQGLLDRVSTGQASAPGRPAQLWSLTDVGRGRLPGRSDEEIGRVLPGATWVIATAQPGEIDAFDVALSDGELLAAADWVAQIDGEGRGYLALFSPEVGPQAPETLLRVLTRLGARCSSGTVRSVQRPDDVIEVLRVAQSAAQRYAP